MSGAPAVLAALVALMGGGPVAAAGTPLPVTVRDIDQGELAPRQQVTALLGGRTVTLEYSRPALRGRAVEALLGQLPPDRIWRMGANQATRLKTDRPIAIGGKRIPAGEYTLYAYLPEGSAWHLLVNRDPGVPLGSIMADHLPQFAAELWPRPSYADIVATEVARVPLRRVPSATPEEFLRIVVAPPIKDRSSITLSWGDQSWAAELTPAR
jgi:hypothetical protein